MDRITLNQCVIVNNTLAHVVGIDSKMSDPDTITNVLVQWANATYQNVNPNEVITLTKRQAHSFILLSEIVYFHDMSVSEVIAGVRIGFTFGGERHDYVIDSEGAIMVVGTPTASHAAKHQEALGYLA